MRVPSALNEGTPISPMLWVIWVRVLVEVSKRKISDLRSLLPVGIRSRLDINAMRVPSALIEAPKLPGLPELGSPVLSLVIWARLLVEVSKRKIS